MQVYWGFFHNLLLTSSFSSIGVWNMKTTIWKIFVLDDLYLQPWHIFKSARCVFTESCIIIIFIMIRRLFTIKYRYRKMFNLRYSIYTFIKAWLHIVKTYFIIYFSIQQIYFSLLPILLLQLYLNPRCVMHLNLVYSSNLIDMDKQPATQLSLVSWTSN